jgi:SOS-response transcriptional repressor LexA
MNFSEEEMNKCLLEIKKKFIALSEKGMKKQLKKLKKDSYKELLLNKKCNKHILNHIARTMKKSETNSIQLPIWRQKKYWHIMVWIFLYHLRI